MRERRARSRFQIPRSLAALAAEHLERRVIEGRLKPGQRLVEQECAADLGLSRGTLREAFRILANSGLVEILPRKGARVVE
ncbi:MAG TPA: GntR family transcriptional regulator, partial [Candidatus Methylomirabilis sp.]|nr:GntR family transcriptional regulator [Candidatus Methylomirabilis sp.]